MEGLRSESEALYAKCLFRTISFDNLKQELLNRSLVVTSDSYYVLTLKLRLAILRVSKCSNELQLELEAELNSFKQKRMGYKCSLSGCKYVSKNYYCLLNHLKSLHYGTEQKIVCQLHGCTRELSNVNMLNMHINKQTNL